MAKYNISMKNELINKKGILALKEELENLLKRTIEIKTDGRVESEYYIVGKMNAYNDAINGLEELLK